MHTTCCCWPFRCICSTNWASCWRAWFPGHRRRCSPPDARHRTGASVPLRPGDAGRAPWLARAAEARWAGVIFQLPAVIYLLARIGIVSAQQPAGTRRYAMVVITILAALITPTGDPYNLLLPAVPMYLLDELGIVLARLVPRPPAPVLPA
ncbi:MAG: twin-arginine translocase subunit TatC [Chloroflexi bacterium]|nr:twin-arginine translocase subunit TatC [Chloroflexota bacterium]